jgi:hypothetical protein
MSKKLTVESEVIEVIEVIEVHESVLDKALRIGDISSVFHSNDSVGVVTVFVDSTCGYDSRVFWSRLGYCMETESIVIVDESLHGECENGSNWFGRINDIEGKRAYKRT